MDWMITPQTYESADLKVHKDHGTPRAAWWTVVVTPEADRPTYAEVVVLDVAKEDRSQGLFLAFGRWHPIALARFVQDVCREIIGEEQEARFQLHGSIPDQGHIHNFVWPEDGERVLLD